MASTIACFWSGTTRPKTELRSSRPASLVLSVGSERASTGSSAPGMPTLRATAATVRGWSPERTLVRTPRTKLPRPSKLAALHFLAELNGTTLVAVQPSGGG
jgi:hypothetical protein